MANLIDDVKIAFVDLPIKATITRHADGQICSTSALPKYLRRKASRVCELATNGHLMGTIAHDTGLSFGQIDRILHDRRLK